MNFLNVICCALILISVAKIDGVLSSNQEEQDYYWQLYIGEIPDDALPGGVDRLGDTTYIGKFREDDEIIVPGEIFPANQYLIYTMRKEPQWATLDFQILCVRNPERYEWINTNITNNRFLTHKHLIPCGENSGYPHLIGRIVLPGRTAVGKIFASKSDEGFAYVAGTAHYITSDEQSFQILTYNPCPLASTKFLTKTVKSDCGDRIYHVYINQFF